MRPEACEWLVKAEADFASMRREAAVTEAGNCDLVCFLAQQSAEKYFKALLCEFGVAFPKTHDLNKLSDLLPVQQRVPAQLAPGLARLDRYSVEFRYPGNSATADLAAEAARDAAEFRAWARASLALEG
jgi:HEPN domain-containing protein